MLIEANVSHIAEQGEVYFSAYILLVVRHVGIELFVVVAGKIKLTVVLIDKLNSLAHTLCGKT